MMTLHGKSRSLSSRRLIAAVDLRNCLSRRWDRRGLLELEGGSLRGLFAIDLCIHRYFGSQRQHAAKCFTIYWRLLQLRNHGVGSAYMHPTSLYIKTLQIRQHPTLMFFCNKSGLQRQLVFKYANDLSSFWLNGTENLRQSIRLVLIFMLLHHL